MTSKARYVTFRLVIQGQTMNHPSDGQTHTLWLLLYSTMVAMYTLYLYRSRVDNLTRCVVLATGILYYDPFVGMHQNVIHTYVASLVADRGDCAVRLINEMGALSFVRPRNTGSMLKVLVCMLKYKFERDEVTV